MRILLFCRGEFPARFVRPIYRQHLGRWILHRRPNIIAGPRPGRPEECEYVSPGHREEQALLPQPDPCPLNTTCRLIVKFTSNPASEPAATPSTGCAAATA